MRYLSLLLVIVFILSCKKKDDSGFPPLYDFSMFAPDSIVMAYQSQAIVSLNISAVGTAQGTVNITATGITDNLLCAFSPKGTTSFTDVVTIASRDSTLTGYWSDSWGYFPIVFYGQGFYGIDSATVNVKVKAPDNVISNFSGNWLMSNQCQVDSADYYNYYVGVALDSASPNGLIITGFSYTTSVLHATIDPFAKTFTIPTQIYGGYTYSGTGNFRIGSTKKSEIDVSYSITGPGVDYSCSGTMTK